MRVRAVDSVKGIVAAAPSALARDLYIDKVAAKIGASADAVRRALAGKPPPQPAKAKAPERPEPQRPLPANVVKAELVILAALVRKPELAPSVGRAVADFVHPGLRAAADAICSGEMADTAVRAIEPDGVRQRVLDEIAVMDQAGDQTDARRLDKLLKKHAQTLAFERKQRASPRVH